MRIKIIGADCSNGIKLSKMVSRAVEELDTKIEVEQVSDKGGKNKYSVTNVPGLMINDKLVSQGKVLTVREIKKLLA